MKEKRCEGWWEGFPPDPAQIFGSVGLDSATTTAETEGFSKRVNSSQHQANRWMTAAF
jgi:hypothetical protein